ncbi:MAG: hypothetical protein HOP03_13100 [Lysobacter sp.]|nr:hypothetical protein [Lysobacter sp.]
MKKSLSGLGVLAALMCAPASAAETSPAKTQMEALEQKIQALQSSVDALRKQADEATASAEEAQAELRALKANGVQIAASPTADGVDSLAAGPESDSMSPPVESLSAADASGSGGANANANANAFNPAISLILNGSYSHHSLDSDAYARAGFPLVGEGAPSPDGFSLGESELTLSSNIDDKLYGQITLAIGSEDGQDDVGIEEAYIETTTLPDGLSLRAGRFFSNIGYLNSHHAHTDGFFDRPLAYQAFLGNQYGDDGVRLSWVAPTSLFLEVGAEVFRGNNFPSGGAQRGGLGTRTLFAHLGGAAGTENEWLAGISALHTRAEGAEDGFSGDSTLYIADGTWKWAPQGNFKDGGFTVRGEYFLDDRDGGYVDPNDPLITSLWNGQRRGVYLEGVYRLSRSWDIGYRYDRLWADSAGPYASAFDPWRHSAELTWRNSEFSLFRLQVSHDKPNADDSDNAVTLQYQTSLGAHGAHKF